MHHVSQKKQKKNREPMWLNDLFADSPPTISDLSAISSKALTSMMT